MWSPASTSIGSGIPLPINPAASMPAQRQSVAQIPSSLRTPIGSRIPLPIYPATPMPAPRNAACTRYQPLDAKPQSKARKRLWPSQTLIQKCYTTIGSSPKQSRMTAQKLLELKNLRWKVAYYENFGADLRPSGSKPHLPPAQASQALSASDLFEIPCKFRDARLGLERTIGKMEKGQKVHRADCNFDDVRQLADRLDGLKLDLTKSSTT